MFIFVPKWNGVAWEIRANDSNGFVFLLRGAFSHPSIAADYADACEMVGIYPPEWPELWDEMPCLPGSIAELMTMELYLNTLREVAERWDY